MVELRFLWRSWIWRISILATVALAVTEVVTAGLDPVAGYGALQARAVALRSLALTVPIVSVLAAIELVSSFQSKELIREAYLGHVRPRRATFRIVLVASISSLGLAALTLVISSTLGGTFLAAPPRIDLSKFEPSTDPATDSFAVVAVVLLAPWMWSFIGAAIASLTQSFPRALGIAVALLTLGVLLRRLASSYPSVRAVYGYSPWGASRTMILGSYFDGHGDAGADRLSGVLLMSLWTLLAFMVLNSRMRHSSAFAREGTRESVDERITRSDRHRRNRWIPYIALCGACATVLVGFFVPPILASRVPWYLQYEWRNQVEERRTPADASKVILGHIKRGDHKSANGLVKDGAISNNDWRVLIRAAGGRSPRNDIWAAQPGTVLVELGKEKTQGDIVLLPDQVTLCFEAEGASWLLTQVSELGSCTAGREGPFGR